jgi:hypothetical protein
MIITPATGRGRIYGSLKDLRIRWEEVQRGWDDPVSKDFDENIYQPLVQQAQAVIRGMDRLGGIMHQMQGECE